MRRALSKMAMVKRCGRRFARNVVFLLANDLQDRFYRVKDEAIEDGVYEFEENTRILPKLNVLCADETFERLLSSPRSYARFGDGEIAIMQGHDSVFQHYDPVLAEKLEAILRNKQEKMYVGLNRAYFQSAFGFAERNHRFYRENGTELRRFFIERCNRESVYLDASCFGAYFRFGDDFDFEGHYSKVKGLFKGKNIILVVGRGVMDDITNDVFEECHSKTMIEAPSRNAFDEYESILKEIRAVSKKDDLICLILGMTATAMVADLAEAGYTAWDIGHIAKDYDVYKKGVEKTEENMSKFWAPDGY